jgi:tetratricopeptide (TPR) repeat protein
VEAALVSPRSPEAVPVRDPAQTQLVVIVALALMVVLAVIFLAWMQLQATHRFVDRASIVRELTAPAHGCSDLEVKSAPAQPASDGTVQPSVAQLRDELQRILHRVEKIEYTATPPYDFKENGTRVDRPGQAPAPAAPTPVKAPETTAPLPEPSERVAILLGKGQTLLGLGRAEEALACFNEGLADNPDHVELLLKKGTAQERLQQLEAALASYDRAIVLNRSLTTAHLLKAGVLSRLGREAEALQCYEFILHERPKAG